MDPADYKPEVAHYFDSLEAKYGPQFLFDRLGDDELLKLERLGRHAIEADPAVSAVEKQLLAPLLTLTAKQREKRGLQDPAAPSIR